MSLMNTHMIDLKMKMSLINYSIVMIGSINLFNWENYIYCIFIFIPIPKLYPFQILNCSILILM